MKAFVRLNAAALGLTTFCLPWLLAPLLNPRHDAIYHWSGSAASIFLPTFIDFCACWLLLALLLFFLTLRRRAATYVWTGIVLLLPWVAARNIFVLYYEKAVPYWASLLLLVLPPLVLLLLLTSSRDLLGDRLASLHRGVATVFAFVSLIGLLWLGQLLWFAWQARHLHRVSWTSPTRTEAAGWKRTRIVWILLDELSYEQIYEHRFPGVNLPAFDQLAAQSTSFTHVVPAGFTTEVVLPALMTGWNVDEIRSSSSAQLSTHQPSTGWQAFDQQQTTFADARHAGYRTAVVGWYNPYCRLLPGVLDSCFWAFSLPTTSHMSSNFSWFQNLLAPFRPLGQGDNRHHIEDVRTLFTAGDAALQNPSLDFVLLHMPVPHPLGIYRRSTGAFATEGGSYIDNLALADCYVAHVREVLEQNNEWDGSAILVMGDHSWRTQPHWASLAGWTSEDQQASHGGKFDDRPAYLVKMPHQRKPAQIGSRFAAVGTRRLLQAIMAGQITSAADLLAWTKSVPRVE